MPLWAVVGWGGLFVWVGVVAVFVVVHAAAYPCAEHEDADGDEGAARAEE